MPMSDLKTYQFKGIYGTTDLWAEDPWLTDYGNWPTFHAHFGFTEADYTLDPAGYAKRVRNRNETYISELKANGKYGTEYIVDITLKHNPLFDDTKIPIPTAGVKVPLESYRMLFIGDQC